MNNKNQKDNNYNNKNKLSKINNSKQLSLWFIKIINKFLLKGA